MPVAEPVDPRAVVALLANPDTRAVLAQLCGGRTLTAGARERALQRLLDAGLLERDPDGATVLAESRLRAALARRASAAGVERFLGADGRILDYPARRRDRLELLQLVAARSLEPGTEVTEAELGLRLERFAEDVATLRRYLVDAGVLERSADGRRYWRSVQDGGSGGSAPVRS